MKRIMFILPLLALMVWMGCQEEATQTTADRPATERRGSGQASAIDEGSAHNVVQIAVSSPDHTTLVKALQAAEYVDHLANVGPFTVFAPTNDAFAALPAGTLDDLMKPENVNTLSSILEYHVLLGVYRDEMIMDGMKVGTVNGKPVEFSRDGDNIRINGHNVLGSVSGSNGLVYVIDGVLVP